jgi:putative alpha-1,2-mannosidase
MVILTKAGMAKAVADTKGENQAGFAFDTEVVTGFSHMHDDGTGGVSFIDHARIVLLTPN